MIEHWGDFVAEKSASFGELALGVDPVLSDIPNVFKKVASSTTDASGKNSATDALGEYVPFIINAAADKVGFVKFQSAFFEAFGSKGVGVLAQGILVDGIGWTGIGQT